MLAVAVAVAVAVLLVLDVMLEVMLVALVVVMCMRLVLLSFHRYTFVGLQNNNPYLGLF